MPCTTANVVEQRLAQEPIRMYTAPLGAAQSTQYAIGVDGVTCPVYHTHVHNVHYAYFDLHRGAAQISVTCATDGYWAEGVRVCPRSKAIETRIQKNTVWFTISAPGHYTIERPTLDYRDHDSEVLVISVNPPAPASPKPDDPDVLYFGPGLHDLGEQTITLTDNKTLYIAGGAVVKAARVTGYKAKNLRICGRGMLYLASPYSWASMVEFRHCCGIACEGVALLTRVGAVRGFLNLLADVDGATFENVKMFGLSDNHDGIHMQAATHVRVSNCFIRSHDDAIAIYGDSQFGTGKQECSDILVQGCVLWPIWSGVCRIGTNNEHYITPTHARRITFKDCDVLRMQDHTEFPYGFLLDMREQAGPRNYEYEDITFEDIRMGQTDVFVNIHLDQTTGGKIRNLRFENVQVETTPIRTVMNDHSPISQGTPGFSFLGCNDFEDIVFRNVSIGGVVATCPHDIGASLHGQMRTQPQKVRFE